jgi:DNA-binding MarR family transcriptional regulator
MEISLFPLEESLTFWMYRIYAQGAASLRKAFHGAGYDVTPEQFFVLLRVSEQAGMTQSQLCEKTFKDRHNMNRILNVLQKQGYIERRSDASDKRVYRIFPREAGKMVLKTLSPIVRNYFELTRKDLSSDDLTNTRRVLEQIVENIEEGIDLGGKP